jgi:hypothetical protein
MQALRASIVTINNALIVGVLRSVTDDLVVLWQSLAERAKGRADLLRDAAARDQRIIDLERELKKVREAAAADKKKLEDELAKERRKDVEATA